MNILCLCPTYGRPRLVANALACFLAQDYPAEKRKLLILDDAGQIDGQGGDGWLVNSTSNRFISLPGKYNAMLASENRAGWMWYDRWDAVAVWDDDDIYLPWHLSAAAMALQNGEPAAKPSAIWSLYQTPTPFREDATGRFHGSLVIDSTRLRALGGWIDTRRADFDQQMIHATGPHAEMLAVSPDQSPSYVYRWGSTGAHHCSAWMKSPDNEDWYDRTPITEPGRIEKLVPRFDEETKRIYAHFGIPVDAPQTVGV